MKVLSQASFRYLSPISHDQRHIRTIFRGFVSLSLWLILVARVDAASVTNVDGRIVYLGPDGQSTILSDSGHDFGPILSPDGARVAFVRSYRTPEDDYIGYTNCSIWIVDITGDNLRCLVTGQDAEDEKERLTDLEDLIFSPDEAELFFHSHTWVTELALHAIKLETGERRYIGPGELKRIVPRGEYANHLLVQQHRYFLGGGSYNWVWLLTPEGKEIGPVTEGDGAHGFLGEDFHGFWSLYVPE